MDYDEDYDEELDRAAQVVAYLEDEGFEFNYGNEPPVHGGDSGEHKVSVMSDGAVVLTAKLDVEDMIAESLGDGYSGLNHGETVDRYSFEFSMEQDEEIQEVIDLYENTKDFTV